MNPCSKDEKRKEFLCYDWYPDVRKIDKVSHHKRLERQYQSLQASYFDLSAEMSRLQFFLKQIVEAGPRDRDRMINELKSKIFRDVDTTNQVHDDSFSPLQQYDIQMGDFKRKQYSLIEMLRVQVGSLEKASEGIPTEVKTAESKADCEPYPEGESYPKSEPNIEVEKNAEDKPEVTEKVASNKTKRSFLKIFPVAALKDLGNKIKT